jgi:hypothetical protein
VEATHGREYCLARVENRYDAVGKAHIAIVHRSTPLTPLGLRVETFAPFSVAL